MADPKPHRIDVHHHLAPPGYIADLDHRGVPIPRELKHWSPAFSIEQMDKGGVERALTSITTPGLWFGDAAHARKLARFCNDYAAELVSGHKGRFGMFVNVPLPDVEGALKEIEYGLDQLKAEGVVLFTSYGDKWLGDPAFDPVMEELNRRKCVVYTHPTTAACCTNILPIVNDSLIEYGTDTTRALTQMVFTGRAAKYAGLRLIWSHGGGQMPFLIVRFTRMARAPHVAKLIPEGFVHEARRFYYDTAAVYATGPMQALRQVVPVERILFGTDVPWGDPGEIARDIAACGVFTPAELRMIDRENALKLFPQFG
jgi:6-methylsalicylate decarboxylase